jgi:threonylcarbamoyladenosine tRNA methylthiotransferase MtaB
MAAITNVRIVRSLARGISSDELNNVLKNAYEISQQNIKEIVLTGVNIEIMERNLGTKHEHTLVSSRTR